MEINGEKLKTAGRLLLNGKHLWKRVIALILALIMLGGSLLTYRAQIRTNGLEYAGTLLEQAYEIASTNSAYMSKSLVDRAWEILNNAVFKPRSYEEFETFASVCIAKGEYEQAARYLRGCIDRYQGDSATELAMLWLREGSLFTLADDRVSAMECFDKALELDASLTDTYLLRAQVKSIGGDAAGAAEDLRRYEALEGSAPLIQAALGSLYESIEDYHSAVECYTVAIDSGEYEVSALASRARCLILLEDTRSAMDDLERFFAEKGLDPSGEYNAMLGMCRMEYGFYDKAIESFHKALIAGYENEYLLLKQCVACGYVLNDYSTVISDGERAVEAAKKLGGMDGEIGELYQWIGLSYFVQDDFTAAAAAFENALSFDPELEFMNYYAGISFMSIDESEKAISYLESSVQRGEYVSVCNYDAAICCIKLGKLDEAAAMLKAAIEAADDEAAVIEAAAMLEQLKEYTESVGTDTSGQETG